MKKFFVAGIAAALAASAVLYTGGSAQAAEGRPGHGGTHTIPPAATAPPQLKLVYSPKSVAGAPVAAAVVTKPAKLPGTIRIRLRGPGYQKFGAGHLFRGTTAAPGDYTFYVHYVPSEESPYAETTVSYPLTVYPAPAAQ